MNMGKQNNSCLEISPLLVFYVCDEVSDQERAAIEQHLANCAACQTQLSEERGFQTAIVSLPRADELADSSGILLSQCRSELAEKLDDLTCPPAKQKAHAFAWLRGWMALHPAWSAATLVLFGLVAGVQSTQWFAGSDVVAQDQAVNVHPSQPLTDDQLSKMVVAGINFTPSPYSGSQNVRVRMSAEQPVELNGNLDDSEVRSVLTFVVKSGERFDSGMRLDCLEALKARAEDSEVRVALLSAARKDQNPAVRLKALEALRDAGVDSVVRKTLLEALQHDSNPGVRVEAVNLLVRSLEQSQQESLAPQALEPSVEPMIQTNAGLPLSDGSIENVIRALEGLQHKDPSRYVRLRSAAALREISARSDQ
ncbi:MAG: HEAT repeat domain-containing protein [Candidatus Acidiferrum sp.]